MVNIARRLMKWDSFVFVYMTKCRGMDSWTRTMRCISMSADGPLYPAMLVLCAMLYTDRWKMLAAWLLSFTIELAAYKAIKQSVKRPRPFHKLAGLSNLIAPPDAFSFPSGHTAGAFVVVSLIGYCCPAIVMPLCLWAGLVGVSRIFLRVHYPTDVLAGACLGIMSARAGLLMANVLIPF
jgi:undecaprenyl-diphosphatase